MGSIDLRSQIVLRSSSEQAIIDMISEIQARHQEELKPFLDALAKIRESEPTKMIYQYDQMR